MHMFHDTLVSFAERRVISMEYLTVRKTSEKWGMSIRMVNYYLNTGRIEGAVCKKSEWLIPYTAKSPLDTRKKADTKKSTNR